MVGWKDDAASIANSDNQLSFDDERLSTSTVVGIPGERGDALSLPVSSGSCKESNNEISFFLHFIN